MLSRDKHESPEPKGRPPATTVEALEEVGDFHRSSDGFGAALEYYENALHGLGVEQEFDAPAAARLNRKISDCYRSKGLLDQALLRLERARAFLKGYEFELEYGIVLRCRAEIQFALGNAEAALRDAELSLEILSSTAAHSEYAAAQMIAAECHGRLGHFAEFEQLNLDALATYRRANDQVGIANIYNNLGVAYKNGCQWDKAIRSLQEAREICERLGLTRLLARTLNNLGIVYTKTREFDEAITHLRRARRLVQSLGDYSTLVSVLNSMGRALLLSGRYAKAEKYLLEARVLAERHHFARSQALADEFLGDLMRVQGRFAEARENYHSGLRKARQLAPKGDVVGEILRRMADLEFQSGLRSQAIATARRALKICLGCSEEHEIGFIHRTIGLGQRALGRTRAAAQALSASAEAFERTRNPYELACTRVALAEVYIEQSGRESQLRAVREAQAAVDAFRRLEEERAYCQAALVLAQAHKATGNHDDGLLVLYDVERICEENPECDCLAQVRVLRREFESALLASTSGESSQLSLFSELYSLANPGNFEAKLHAMLQSLTARTECTAAFLSLVLPGHREPAVKGVVGMDRGEALHLSRHFVATGLAGTVLAQVDGGFAEVFPAVAERAGALLCQPLAFEDRKLGLLYLERPRADQPVAFSQDEVDFVATYANLGGVVLYELFREEFQSPEPERSGGALHPALSRVITADPAMFRVLALSEKVAHSNCTVLLGGETGTGKGLLAWCVHQISERHSRKFIALNCAALPEQLLESELFGHVRGAFTGAEATKIGLLEAAHGGSVFLDEVGQTSLFMQGKLLQFLDSSEVRPVGSNEFRKVDVRVICASKSDLREQVEKGRFLEDLYYRLNDFPVTIPPLRERVGDVKLLIDHCLTRYATELHKRITGISRQAMHVLQQYAWPGNVRELEKCVKRAVILAEEGGPIGVRHLPDEIQFPERRRSEAAVVQEGLTLREHLSRVEAELIAASMRKSAGNKSEAARILGISYPNLLQKIKLYGCEPSAETE
jgi:transcriptional regulator with GAF, ATPase, and Fis domain/tetratricopeptide (TPR) repeat protein